jgi:hypothetical protein
MSANLPHECNLKLPTPSSHAASSHHVRSSNNRSHFLRAPVTHQKTYLGTMSFQSLPDSCLELLVVMIALPSLGQMCHTNKASYVTAQPSMVNRQTILPPQHVRRLTRYMYANAIAHLGRTCRDIAYIIRPVTTQKHWTSGALPAATYRLPNCSLPRGFPPFLYHYRGFPRGTNEIMDQPYSAIPNTVGNQSPRRDLAYGYPDHNRLVVATSMWPQWRRRYTNGQSSWHTRGLWQFSRRRTPASPIQLTTTSSPTTEDSDPDEVAISMPPTIRTQQGP